jgi:hypothetical protein
VRTYHSARVGEAFKAHDSFAGASTLVIVQDGGEHREGAQIWRAINLEPELVPGKEYILFLAWRKDEQAFRPYFGPALMFELQQDNLTLPPRGVATKFVSTASTTEFVTELRAIAAKHARP